MSAAARAAPQPIRMRFALKFALETWDAGQRSLRSGVFTEGRLLMDRRGTWTSTRSTLGLCAAVLFWSSLAIAQVTTGTILGTVKDQTGAVLPGATVTATNVETGISRSATTGGRGEYRLQA